MKSWTSSGCIAAARTVSESIDGAGGHARLMIEAEVLPAWERDRGDFAAIHQRQASAEARAERRLSQEGELPIEEHARTAGSSAGSGRVPTDAAPDIDGHVDIREQGLHEHETRLFTDESARFVTFRDDEFATSGNRSSGFVERSDHGAHSLGMEANRGDGIAPVGSVVISQQDQVGLADGIESRTFDRANACGEHETTASAGESS